MSINRGTDREDTVHTHNGGLATKKSKIMLSATTLIGLETDIQSEVNWTQKDKYDIAYT